MSKKRKTSGSPIKGWEPFVRTLPAHNDWYAKTYPDLYAKDWMEFQSGKQSMWRNNRYTVIQKDLDDGMTWLSIRHNDRKAIRDWRHFQRIKNELCGPEREGIELYPAESRLVDEANQYHLWVLPEGMRVPVGFGERMVGVDEEGIAAGAKQRPFEEDSNAE